jgi:hypothetical protein
MAARTAAPRHCRVARLVGFFGIIQAYPVSKAALTSPAAGGFKPRLRPGL